MIPEDTTMNKPSTYTKVAAARAAIHKKIQRLQRGRWTRETGAKIAALEAEAGALVLDW